jgi:NACalpha-BTF3-like transcription factor
MKLAELLERLNGVQFQAAVYDELIAHLQKCLDDGVEIPVDIADGYVPEDDIKAVMAQLRMSRDKMIEKLDLAEEVEVTGVGHEDFAIV